MLFLLNPTKTFGIIDTPTELLQYAGLFFFEITLLIRTFQYGMSLEPLHSTLERTFGVQLVSLIPPFLQDIILYLVSSFRHFWHYGSFRGTIS